jgi:hypothetical protein
MNMNEKLINKELVSSDSSIDIISNKRLNSSNE